MAQPKDPFRILLLRW